LTKQKSKYGEDVTQKWVNRKKNMQGVLAPDLDGYRYIMTLNDREFHKFQVEKEAFDDSTNLVEVGRFCFLASTFDLAQKEIRNAWNNSEWLVIDEVGKLEMMDRGLEPVVKETIDRYKYHEMSGKLLLVVRDYLLEDMLAKYDIKNYKLINSQFFGV